MAAQILAGFRTGFGSTPFLFALERLASFGSYAWNEVKLLWGVEDVLRKLQRTMLMVQDLMDNIERSTMLMVQDLVDSAECSLLRFMGGSKAWRIWFEDMKKLSYDVDALLGDISLHLSTYGSVGTTERDDVRKYILSSGHLKLPHNINELQNKLEHLAKEMETLQMIEKMKTSFSLVSPHVHNFLSTSSLIDERNVVERETDKLDCVADLLKSKP